MNEPTTRLTTTRLKTKTRTRFTGRLVSAGRVRDVLDRPGEIVIPAQALRTAVADGLFERLACFIDHAGCFEGPSLKNLFGLWSNIAWNEESEAVEGTLTVYDNEQTRPLIQVLRQALEDAQQPDLGVSIVFYGIWEQAAGQPRVLNGFRKIESADLVFMLASTGSRILEALSALNHQPVGEGPRAFPPSLGGKQLMTNDTEIKQSPVETARETSLHNARPNFVEENQQLSTEWLGAIKQSGLHEILRSSDLPDVVKTRLARQSYDTPEQVRQAVQEAHEELQELDREETVELGSRPWIYVKDPQDSIRSHVDWFFGVEDAPTPPPNYRRLDQLYVAMTGDSEFYGVFQPDRVMLAAATTSTLAGMTVDAMNKVVMTQFSRLTFWRWYEQIAYPIPNDGSVQDMKLITFGGVGNLPTVAEGAAYTELTVDDTKETASFAKKGGYVGITLEMIRNSAIVEIQAVPKALAIASVRTRSAAVSTLFTTASGVGPTLDQDSKALFHADHNNVATTALGTDNSAWRAARLECFGHTEVQSGKALAVFPKFLLVPDDLYDQALVNLGIGEGMPTSYTPEAQARNAEDPRPVPLVVPDWTDANDWAYIVDPRIYPVIQISYAQAPGGGRHPAPELYSVTDERQGLLFTNDVMPIKVRDWFAVNVNGPRGIGKRNVA